MKRVQRRKDGRFKAKSAEDRKVRSIRATDSAWESLGDLAEAQNMSRADLVEQLIEEGQLDFIQGLEIVQAIASTLNTRSESIPPQALADALSPDQELQPLQELAVRLRPIKDLVAYLNNVQTLTEKLEPIQQLAQHIESVKNLAEKLEPIQSLAHQLAPLSHLESIQELGDHVDIIQTAARQLEGARHEPDAEEMNSLVSSEADSTVSFQDSNSEDEETLAIALHVVDRFLEVRANRTSPSGAQAFNVKDKKKKKTDQKPSSERLQEIKLSEFRKWLVRKL